MGDLYDLRSHIEHLHENQHLETFNRVVRIEIARKEAVSEFIARTCLVRILGSAELRKHFGNVDALRSFWQLEKVQQIALWGPPIDPLSAFDGFEFEYISDYDLGKPH